MSQPTPAEGWSELLLALPEFILTGARFDEHDELVADVELPRDVQPCIRCGVIELHPLHDYRTHTVRHLPVAGRACRVQWRKRLLACVEAVAPSSSGRHRSRRVQSGRALPHGRR